MFELDFILVLWNAAYNSVYIYLNVYIIKKSKSYTVLGLIFNYNCYLLSNRVMRVMRRFTVGF